jgi:pumilio homology domain family member 6
MEATKRSHKKRPAPSQSGPSPKKMQLAKSLKASTSKEKGESKRRSRPVTLPVQNDSQSEGDELDDEGFDDVDIGEDNDEMAVDGGPGVSIIKDPHGSSIGSVDSNLCYNLCGF